MESKQYKHGSNKAGSALDPERETEDDYMVTKITDAPLKSGKQPSLTQTSRDVSNSTQSSQSSILDQPQKKQDKSKLSKQQKRQQRLARFEEENKAGESQADQQLALERSYLRTVPGMKMNNRPLKVLKTAFLYVMVRFSDEKQIIPQKYENRFAYIHDQLRSLRQEFTQVQAESPRALKPQDKISQLLFGLILYRTHGFLCATHGDIDHLVQCMNAFKDHYKELQQLKGKEAYIQTTSAFENLDKDMCKSHGLKAVKYLANNAKKDSQAYAVINMLYMTFQNQYTDLIEFIQKRQQVGHKQLVQIGVEIQRTGKIIGLVQGTQESCPLLSKYLQKCPNLRQHIKSYGLELQAALNGLSLKFQNVHRLLHLQVILRSHLSGMGISEPIIQRQLALQDIQEWKKFCADNRLVILEDNNSVKWIKVKETLDGWRRDQQAGR